MRISARSLFDKYFIGQAIIVSGGHPDAYAWRTEAKNKMGQHQNAPGDVHRAVYLAGGIWAYFIRALIFAKLGNANALRKDFEHILRRFPDPARFIMSKGNYPNIVADHEIINFLKVGLELGRGNRRDEEYAANIWMANS